MHLSRTWLLPFWFSFFVAREDEKSEKICGLCMFRNLLLITLERNKMPLYLVEAPPYLYVKRYLANLPAWFRDFDIFDSWIRDRRVRRATWFAKYLDVISWNGLLEHVIAPWTYPKKCHFRRCEGFSFKKSSGGKPPDPHFYSLRWQSSPPTEFWLQGKEVFNVESGKLKKSIDLSWRISRLPESNAWYYSNYHRRSIKCSLFE